MSGEVDVIENTAATEGVIEQGPTEPGPEEPGPTEPGPTEPGPTEQNEELVLVEDEEQEEEQDEEYHFNEQTRIETIKSLFSQLDPAIVKAQGDAMGELGVALKYKEDKELLLVRVMAAQGLGSRQVGHTSLNPQVEVIMLDDENMDVVKTSIKKNTSSPAWNEILVFKIEEFALEGTRVLFRVRAGNEIIGEVMVTLDWDMLDGEPNWFDLEDQKDWSISGAVHVKVWYKSPSTLHVNIRSSEGLAAKNKTTSDPYVRVTLAGKYPVKTTKVIRNTVNPVWSETFKYALPIQLLHTGTILIAVYNKCTLKTDDFLGEARISLADFKHYQEIDDWFPLADLKHVARHRSEWSKGAFEQELREALVAHVACRSPQLLFNNANPGKTRVLRLSCPKTGQKSRVSFVNGQPVLQS